MDTIAEIDINNAHAWSFRSTELRKSFEAALNTKKASLKIQYERGIADSHKILGYCFWRFSDFTESLAHSITALEIFQRLSDKKGEADTLNSIGAVYMFQKEHKKRLECNLKCLQLREESGDVVGASSSQNNIGETYLEMDDLQSAGQWFKRCLDNPDSTPQTRAWALFNLGKVQRRLDNLEECEKYFLSGLENALSIKYDVLAAEIFLQLSKLHFTKNNFPAAEEFALKGLGIADSSSLKEERKHAYESLAAIKEKMGDLKAAIEFHKKYFAAHTEIFNEFNTQKIRDIEYHYEIDKITKEAEFERLKAESLKLANDAIEIQRNLLEERNKEITDSLVYAFKIQQALLKQEEKVVRHLPEHFILFKPKDIVSGDFYWAFEKNSILVTAVADCTGHGVPGAFLTLLGLAFLNEIVRHQNDFTPASILEELREKIIDELNTQGQTRDGMDISILMLNLQNNEAMWAGANNPLWIFSASKKEIECIKPDKQPIGYAEIKSQFTNHRIKFAKGDQFYMFSDGYADQFGGEGSRAGKKMKKAGFRKKIAEISNSPMHIQLQQLEAHFEKWKGRFEQVDDVCVMGMKL